MSCKLKEVLKEKGYIRGPFGSALKRSEMKEEGIPVYEQQNAINNHRKFRYYIDEEKFNTLKRFTVEANDLIISCSGTVGKVSIINENDPIGIISQALLILRPNTDIINPKFLYYFFQSSKGLNSILSRSTGSVQVNIAKRDIIENIELELPSLENQDKIVNILSSLDDKIELNNEMNKTLEEMAQSIFKRWVVDFEFPNEDGQPYKSSGGEMVESELGMIPKGWEVKSLDEIADFLNGLAMQKFRPSEEDTESLPVLKIKELKQGNTNKDSDRCSCNIEDKYIINDGDVIFAWSGSLDVRIWCGGKAGLNQHLFKVTSKDYPKWFYYLWTKRYLDEFIRIAADRATTMGHIKRSNLSEAKVLVPDNITIKSMGEKLSSLLDIFIEKSIESKYLEELRSTILPKLMNGYIKIN